MQGRCLCKRSYCGCYVKEDNGCAWTNIFLGLCGCVICQFQFSDFCPGTEPCDSWLGHCVRLVQLVLWHPLLSPLLAEYNPERGLPVLGGFLPLFGGVFPWQLGGCPCRRLVEEEVEHIPTRDTRQVSKWGTHKVCFYGHFDLEVLILCSSWATCANLIFSLYGYQLTSWGLVRLVSLEYHPSWVSVLALRVSLAPSIAFFFRAPS